jgi:hypothetical protein
MPSNTNQNHAHKIGNINFSVDGYEVSATFANSRNTAAIGQVKQILLSSFSNTTKTRPRDILAIVPEQRDNSSGGTPRVP